LNSHIDFDFEQNRRWAFDPTSDVAKLLGHCARDFLAQGAVLTCSFELSVLLQHAFNAHVLYIPT